MPISRMWRAIFSLSYHMGLEWRPNYPLGEMWSAGGSQKPQSGPVAKRLLLYGCLLEPITGFWQTLTQNWMQRTQMMTRKWRKRQKKGNCTEWPRFTTFWWCGGAAKTYVLPRRNLARETSISLPWDTFQIRKRLSEHCGHCFAMMERLHFYCQDDLLCHHLCLQRTSLEAKLEY